MKQKIALIPILILITGCLSLKEPVEENYKITVRKDFIVSDTIELEKFRVLLPRNGVVNLSRLH